MRALGLDVLAHAAGVILWHVALSVQVSMMRSTRFVVPMIDWVLGCVVGVVLTGWPWRTGAALNLDLVALGDLDVPETLFGQGADIARRAPLQGLLALVSPPLSAGTVTRVWMVAVVAIAFVGMVRHLRDVDRVLALAGGLAFAASPFLATRLAVGHLGFATACALLPWTVETLARPHRRPAATVAVLCGFALCGYFGMIVAGPVLLAGLVEARRWPPWREVAVVAATQVPWLVPALFGLGAAAGDVGSAAFGTDVDGIADAIGLLVGFGFWRSVNQVGADGVVVVVVALALLALAVSGYRYGSRRTESRVVAALGIVGFVVVVAAVVPPIATWVDAATGTVVFAPVRESHRLIVFTVFALVAFGVRGAEVATALRTRALRWVAALMIAAASVALMGASWWGLDGQLDTVEIPRAWDEVAKVIEAEPGTTLVLPWNQYFDVEIAAHRRAHHPLPFFLPGDLISRHDLGIGGSATARDEREAEAGRLLRRLRFGEEIGEDLAALGVRWVAALPDLGTDDVDRLVASGAGAVVVDDPTITVVAVTAIDEAIDDADGRCLVCSWRGALVLAVDLAWVALAVTSVRRSRVQMTDL